MSQDRFIERRISRRGALGAGAAVAAGLAFGASRLADAPAALAAGEPLAQPPILKSANGVLNATLEAKISPIVVNGATKNIWSYNGVLPGPTLMVKPGDTVNLKFKNSLVGAMSNLHYHGMHISPNGVSDNVFLEVDPAAEQDYVLKIPQDHEPGMHWYHPHMHGSGTQQMFGGLAGAIIVRGGLDNVKNIAALPDRVFVLQATKFNGNDVATFSAGGGSGDASQLTHLVNGQVQPVVVMKTDRYERWRFLNATVSVFYQISLNGHEFIQVAADGNTYREYDHISSFVLAPGNRAEVLVKAGIVGNYDLVGTSIVGPPAAINLAKIKVKPTFSPAPTTSLHALPQFEDLRLLPLARTRELHWNFSAGQFTIDGEVFDPDRIDQVVKLGDVEQWTHFNDHTVPHPFHIHTNPFQVVKVNDTPVDALSYQDTVVIPPGGTLTVLMRFLDFTGKSVFHCHIIPHADAGMMGTFRITKTGLVAESLALDAQERALASANPYYCDIAPANDALVAEPVKAGLLTF